jgi:lipopolysaccharide/colanic/teichoic acid biosynthesis glycosyltransferase
MSSPISIDTPKLPQTEQRDWRQEHYPNIALSGQDAWLYVVELTQRRDVWRLVYMHAIKPAMDIIVALALLITLSPLLLIIALAIRLDGGGQAIFKQTRIGKSGQPFTIYKFRTMVPDRRRSQQPFEGEDRRKHHKRSDDPRVTRVGRWLRRTSLDELPQLINIVRGDMSFVGPRPELPQIVARYAPWQHQRHLLVPGLTGWWQVNGRSDLPMHEHTELDMYYVKHVSLWFDLVIVLRTFHSLLLRSGAFVWLPIAYFAASSVSKVLS